MPQKISDPSRQNIWKMFDQIAPTYDRINRAMTFGCDLYWRKKMAHFLPPAEKMHVLDCATGTGDQLFSLLASCSTIAQAVGIDLSSDMLDIAKEKAKRLQAQIDFQLASLLALPFPENTFDCVTISFGIRNVVDVPCALKECYRVLKPHGRLLILESSLPKARWLHPFFLFYLRQVLPRIGGWLSKNKEAYRYLNKTIETFPSGEQFCSLLREAGFARVHAHPLTAGVVTIYTGDKIAPG